MSEIVLCPASFPHEGGGAQGEALLQRSAYTRRARTAATARDEGRHAVEREFAQIECILDPWAQASVEDAAQQEHIGAVVGRLIARVEVLLAPRR